MTYVVTESCIKCKYTECVDNCPVDCFHEGPNMLVIDPFECIDCGVCVDDCPIDAIYDEDDVPKGQEHFIKINEDMSQKWPVISWSKDPFDDADHWAGIDNKIDKLEK